MCIIFKLLIAVIKYATDNVGPCECDLNLLCLDSFWSIQVFERRLGARAVFIVLFTPLNLESTQYFSVCLSYRAYSPGRP